MIINHQGQSYEITNWDEFQDTLLEAIGLQVEDEIVQQINNMRLVGVTGNFKGSIKHYVKNGDLTIYSTAEYAQYLEYGTFDYWQNYGLESFPSKPFPKKKDVSRKERSGMPKGMQPFAPFRRVLYNPQLMEKVINKAVKLASK